MAKQDDRLSTLQKWASEKASGAREVMSPPDVPSCPAIPPDCREPSFEPPKVCDPIKVDPMLDYEKEIQKLIEENRRLYAEASRGKRIQPACEPYNPEPSEHCEPPPKVKEEEPMPLPHQTDNKFMQYWMVAWLVILSVILCYNSCDKTSFSEAPQPVPVGTIEAPVLDFTNVTNTIEDGFSDLKAWMVANVVQKPSEPLPIKQPVKKKILPYWPKKEAPSISKDVGLTAQMKMIEEFWSRPLAPGEIRKMCLNKNGVKDCSIRPENKTGKRVKINRL